MRRALPVAIAAILGLVGCGDSGGDSPETTPVPPPAPQAIAQARSAVQAYCAEVAKHLAGERGQPTEEELEGVTAAIDALAVRADLTPEATTADGSTPRLALGDIAENLEGTNCDSRLVELIDERLATLPPG